LPSEIDLLRSLDDEPPTPSTVDVDRAITVGRRRHRRRAVGYAGVAALTVVAVAGVAVVNARTSTRPSPNLAATKKPSASAKPKPAYTIPGTAGWKAPAATAPTSCTIEKLPVPDGEPQALIGGGDPTGAYYVGRTYPKGGGYQAVIWHGDSVKKVMLPGDSEESMTDVNSSGDATGWSYLNDAQVPFAYVNGKVVKLPGVKAGNAAAINDAGAIVGADASAPGGDTASKAVVWASATAKPVKLPVPAGTTSSTASDIDEDGTTVGDLDQRTPYVWFPDGTHHDLPLPSYQGKKAASARVFAIRNGIAIGAADEKSEEERRGVAGTMWATQWNVRTGEAVVLDQFDMRPDAINAQGWKVGVTKSGYAILDVDGPTFKLPMLADHKPGLLTNIPKTISDDGRTIGGQSDDAKDVIHAVLWRCK
jgi:uncharacterized membrane protein